MEEFCYLYGIDFGLCIGWKCWFWYGVGDGSVVKDVDVFLKLGFECDRINWVLIGIVCYVCFLSNLCGFLWRNDICYVGFELIKVCFNCLFLNVYWYDGVVVR